MTVKIKLDSFLNQVMLEFRYFTWACNDLSFVHLPPSLIRLSV